MLRGSGLRRLPLPVLTLALVLLATTPLMVSPGLGQEYSLGVVQGDIATYSVVVTWNSNSLIIPEPSNFAQLNWTSRIRISVVAVSAPNVTLQLTQNLENRTVRIGSIILNTRTGAADSSGTVPDFPSPILTSANLKAQDPISVTPGSPTLNSTRTTKVLGTSRTVNLLNTTVTGPEGTSSTGLAWDQTSGILVQAFTSRTLIAGTGESAQGLISIDMIGTDVWTGFLFSANPSALTITRPSFASSLLGLSGSNGFTGTVKLSVNAPSGITAYLIPSSVTIPLNQLATSILQLSVSPALSLGQYSLTVNASSPHTSHSITLGITLAANTQLACGLAGTCLILTDANITSTRYIQGTIHFSAEGPTGTSSFANVTIPRTAASSTNDIHVFVDGAALPNSEVAITNNAVDYFAYFRFTFHSPAYIDIIIDQPPEHGKILGISPTTFYQYLTGGAVLVLGIGFLTFGRKKRNSGNVGNSPRANRRSKNSQPARRYA